MSITEKYTAAQNAKDLRIDVNAEKPVDVLIAAGLAPGILGHALMRLHGEWDAAAKPRNITQTDATLLYGRLKSLPRVLGIISEYLTTRGEDKPLVGAKALVMYWLDDRCQPCGGKGAPVMPGAPVLGRRCKVCGGGGKRKSPVGELGKQTLNMMDKAVEDARRSIRKRLHNTYT